MNNIKRFVHFSQHLSCVFSSNRTKLNRALTLNVIVCVCVWVGVCVQHPPSISCSASRFPCNYPPCLIDCSWPRRTTSNDTQFHVCYCIDHRRRRQRQCHKQRLHPAHHIYSTTVDRTGRRHVTRHVDPSAVRIDDVDRQRSMSHRNER